MNTVANIALSPREQRIAAAKNGNPASPRWLISYYVVQIVCQLALLSTALAPGRVFFRTSAFGMSLVALVFTYRASRIPRRHPATVLALVALLILGAEMLNPGTADPLAALATVGMYVAVLSPLVWVPRLALDLSWFRRVVVIIWAFQSASALVGALQVYFPGVFEPAVASILSDSYVSAMQITLASGERILRPSGLSDTPGGAAVAGTYAIILALGLWAERPARWMQILLALSVATGMFVLYVCQVRSLVVMVGISVLATTLVHALRGRIRSVFGISAVAITIAIAAFVAASSVGGDDVTRRMSTLVNSSPTEVYYTNRGIFLEHTLSELLPLYPFGAGLGRWGMAASYFGGQASNSIYVEIQWTGWLLDGGIPLIFTYVLMLVLTVLSAWSMARRHADRTRDLSSWAALLVGYDVGTIALTFNFPVFMASFGMDFWLLNAALFTVVVRDLAWTSPEVATGPDRAA